MTNRFCPNFERCGGCLYLDLNLDDYINKKKNFILNSFSHEGIDLKLDDFILIDFGTRRRATFAFKKGLIGFNAKKSHQITPLESCPALILDLNQVLSSLKPVLKELNKSGDIFVQKTKFGIDMHIKTSKKEMPSLNERMLLAEFANTSIVNRLYYNDEPILEKNPSPYPVDLFLQPSKEGEEALINLVLSNITPQDKNIIDLFSGAGTFTTPLLLKGLQVKGYDVASESILVLKENGIKRDLFRNPLIASEFENIDVVIMDPPRAGAKEQTKELKKSSVKKIIMISCNPISAARDAKALLENGWHISKAVGVDQFIYTNHTEIMCIFEK